MAAPRGFTGVFHFQKRYHAHFINILIHRSRSKSINYIPKREISKNNYSKKSKRKPNFVQSKDPRYNIQYPYVHGDPTQQRRDGGKKDILDLTALQKQMKIEDSMSQFTTSSGLSYTKLKDGDIRLGRTILSIKSKASVDSSKVILLEGQRLIKDALLLGTELKYIYFSDEKLLENLPIHLLKDVVLFKVTYGSLRIWLDTTTPSGIMGIFRKPEQGQVMCPPRESVLPITLILDGVKDPGNAGTLIRTAAAVGCERILAVKGCVNMWAAKVLRSGMGGHFAIPIYTNLDWSHVHNYTHENTQVFLAIPKPPNLLHGDYGNLQDKLEAWEVQEMNESESSDSSDDEGVSFRSKNRRHDDDLFNKVPFPSSLYCDANLQTPVDSVTESDTGTKHVSLVVGGETSGLSAPAKKFAYEYYGQYISLPMSEHIDSLNTAVAASVILYEFRRKLMNGV